MANFNTHLEVGFVTSAILSVVLYKAGLLNNHEFIWCTILGTAGGLLPDIDSNNSTPIKLGFNLLSLTAGFAVVIQWRSELPLLFLLLAWAGCFLTIRYIFLGIFTSITSHRGVIHSIPYMMCAALALVSTNYYFLQTPVITSWLYGMFLFTGSIVHLLLDELYAVNLLNVRLKRSFGTALKLYNVNKRYYFLMVYLILIILIKTAPPFDAFWHKLTDPITWLILSKSII